MINVGVHEPSESEKLVKNTLLWIDSNGEIIQRYQKIHLFQINDADGPTLMESSSVQCGMGIVPPFDTPLGRIGMMICFDVGKYFIPVFLCGGLICHVDANPSSAFPR